MSYKLFYLLSIFLLLGCKEKKTSSFDEFDVSGYEKSFFSFRLTSVKKITIYETPYKGWWNEKAMRLKGFKYKEVTKTKDVERWLNILSGKVKKTKGSLTREKGTWSVILENKKGHKCILAIGSKYANSKVVYYGVRSQEENWIVIDRSNFLNLQDKDQQQYDTPNVSSP